MYEDKKLKINWVDIGIKVVLLIAFVLLIIWLIPKNDLSAFNDSVYTTNINNMKDAARSYYTKDRLPLNIGESKSMTLQEMFDKHMLVEFKDKDGKTCDTASSKVEVTKISDNEYALKVQLNCGSQRDYIIETIGCNDVCPDGKCDVVEEDKKEEEENTDPVVIPSTPDISIYETTTYYQFRKAVITDSIKYTCPEDYTLDGKTCYKGSTGTVIDATPIRFPDQTLITDAKYNYSGEYTQYIDPIVTVVQDTYTCPTGYTKNGAYCIKYISSTVIPGSTTYTCPTGYTLDGTKCTKSYNASYMSGSYNYTCPNGGTLNSSTLKCVITTNVTKETKEVCPSGYTANGSSCYKLYTPTSKTTYSCPSGYTLDGTTCKKESNPSYNTTYSAWKAVGGVQYKTSATAAYVGDTSKLELIDAISGATCGTPCGNKGIWYMYQEYSRTATKTAYCTTGTLNSSKTKCVVTTSATSKTDKTCPNGGSYDSSTGKCKITTSKTTETSKTCPSGYTLVGTSCKMEIPATRNIQYSYTCPSGYTQSGSGASTKCYRIVKGTTTYYCEDANATLNGTKCYTTVPGSIKNYTCPSDEYILNGTKCAKRITVNIPATETKTEVTTYKYTWSTKTELEGWEFTGKTKTEKYTAGQK